MVCELCSTMFSLWELRDNIYLDLGGKYDVIKRVWEVGA